MKSIRSILAGAVLALLAPSTSRAQILVAGEGPVAYGHHHLNTTDMAAQKKFYVDTLGDPLRPTGRMRQSPWATSQECCGPDKHGT